MTNEKIEIIAIVFDVDGSVMIQGGPMKPQIAEIMRFLSELGIKLGPATGKNCDYARGLACGVGTIWDFIIGETGAQFLETTFKGSPPAFRQRLIIDAGKDITVFARRIDLNPYERNFTFYDRKENFRPELKEGIITLFPPGQDIELTEEWRKYFEDIIKTYHLRLKVQRHSDGCIDIVPMQINKELGLEQVCQLYGIKRENILVVADGVNDLELTIGTNVIAVGNAVAEIKTAASKPNCFVAGYPDGLGFAEGLLYFAEQGRFPEGLNEKIKEKIQSLKIFKDNE